MLTRKMLTLGGAALLAAGCAGNPGQEQQRMTATLAQLDAADYTAQERCLSTFEYDSVEVLNDQYLLFRDDPAGDHWLNKLQHRCPGLREQDTLAFEMHGSRVCSLDTATVVDHFLFWRREGPTCSLGEFQQLSDAQAGMVKEAM